MKIKRFFHHRVLAGTISTACLVAEVVVLSIVFPVGVVVKSDTVTSVAMLVFNAVALTGISAALIAATQARIRAREHP